MAIGLPGMAYADGITKRKQLQFGGYNHRLAAENGELWDMENLTGDQYPILSPRPPRWSIRQLEKPNGIYAHDGLYWVDGTGFYAGGEEKGQVTDGKKRFASLGAYIVILPDLAFYNRLTGEFGSMTAAWSGEGSLRDGSFAGEAAKANSIYSEGADWDTIFRVGDGVSISGCTVHEGNNKTAVIREIDGDTLRFYENCFTIGEGGDAEPGLCIAREIPELDFICENENRLWGCKGDTIYASKLGDIFNWNVFDGLATDSFAVNVGSAGDFTAAYSYMGYPCFFKEEHIYKVYGDRPANFQVMGSASMGVEKGSAESLAIAGETLFYLSRTGVAAYTGGMPQSIAAPFGAERYQSAVGGSDGTKYYISMADREGNWHLFGFDTRTGLWHREDGTQAVGFGWDGELYCLNAQGELWMNGNARTVPEGAAAEGPVRWRAEWADFYEYSSSSTQADTPEKKGLSKLLIRVELEAGSQAQIDIQFDSDGLWRPVKTLGAEKKRSYYLPVIPRRCDHFRLRMTGEGGCRLYSLVREVYDGSEL